MGILDRAELLLQAKNYSGSGDWLDESGNGHDAQLGSTSGADTNDPLFKPWNGTDYLYLPGSSGNYASTADVNLLDADTAHCHQSIGTWVNFNAAASIQQSTALTPYIGDNHGQCGIDSDGSVDAGPRTPTTGEGGAVPVTAGNTYSFTIRLASDRNANSARITLLWWDETGNSQVGGNVDGTVTALSDSGWTEVVLENQTAPAGAEAVIVALNIKGGTWTSGDLLYWDALCVSESASATFVPSLRIVGDLDIETKLACTSFTAHGAEQTILDNYDFGSAAGFRLSILNAGGVRIQGGGSVGVIDESIPDPGFADGSPAVVRVTTTTAGNVVYYLDGVQVGTDTFTAQAWEGSSIGYWIGSVDSNVLWLDGDLYYVIVRDGIDGPIVAKYDPADASEPFATHTGAQDGRTWTHNRSASGLVSTVVDRDMFLLTTDDYFTIPDDDALDFGAGEDYTVLIATRSTFTTGNPRLLSKARYGSVKGYAIYRVNATTVGTFNYDGSSTILDSAVGTFGARTLQVAGARRTSGSALEAFLDGTGSGSPGVDTGLDLASTEPLYIGREVSAPAFEGQIIAVALFREALTDNEIYLAGRSLVKQVDDPQDLHGDALKTWIMENDSNWTSSMSTELVGLLNDLNGTSGKEYAEARATYLSVDPAG